MAAPDYLQPGEQALLERRRHPASFAIEAAAIVLLFGGLAAGALVGIPAADPALLWSVAVPLAATAAVTGIALLVAAAFRMRTSRYVLTAERVYQSHGRIRFHLVQTTYDKLTDVHVRQGPLGRRFGYGSLRVGTAGAGVHLTGVPDPFGFKRSLEEARSAFLRTLVTEHRRTARTAPAAPVAQESTGPAVTLWNGRPAPASFVGRLIGISATALPGIVLVAVGAVAAQGMLFFGLALLAFALLNGAAAFIQYRFTAYMITGRGVVVTSGWLTRRRVETTFEKVTDVTTTQGLLGRLLDYGTITINTAGSNEAPISFHGLGEPERVKALIDEARSRAQGGAA